MSNQIHIYLPEKSNIKLPTQKCMRTWINNCLVHCCKDDVELEVSFVGVPESQALNKQYRGKDKPTNVLSFNLDLPRISKHKMLGNLILCLPVIQAEAEEQQKTFNNHLAHLLTHGCLHLLGYDHEQENDAKIMENLEVELLAKLGIENPYA